MSSNLSKCGHKIEALDAENTWYKKELTHKRQELQHLQEETRSLQNEHKDCRNMYTSLQAECDKVKRNMQTKERELCEAQQLTLILQKK